MIDILYTLWLNIWIYYNTSCVTYVIQIEMEEVKQEPDSNIKLHVW